MIRVSAVSYLNTKPFIYGLEKNKLPKEIELSLDIPSVCASKLIDGKADIGLVPVAVLPQLKGFSIISDYCIGATGPVRSVMLFSKVPLNEIKEVLLDNQSRTSVLLVRVLADKHWKIQPAWSPAKEGYEKNIEGATAGVVIGDRALKMKGMFPYAYDLAEEWQKMTGLPFVFACWVGKEGLDKAFLEAFSKALGNGIDRREEMVNAMGLDAAAKAETSEYLGKAIDYRFDNDKKKALQLFLEYSA